MNLHKHLEEIHEKFYNHVNSLILLSKQHRDEVGDKYKKIMSPDAYVKYFCTISCSIGGSSGGAEYIKRQSREDSLVICPSLDNAKAKFGEAGFDILSAEQIVNGNKRKDKDYRNIYVYSPLSIFKIVSIEAIYYLFVDSVEVPGMVLRDQTFILLDN